MQGRVWLPFLVVLVPLVAAPARAERLEFAAGGAVVGPVEIDGDRVILDGPTGRVAFARSSLRRVEAGHWPPSEWPARRDAARSAAVADRFAAAWWALENGLTPECAAELRAIHGDDPAHQPTARLVEILDGLSRPVADPPPGSIPDVGQSRLRTARSDHVLLFHRLDPAEARDRLDLLERVLISYYLSLSAYGVGLDLPRERAVVVWFGDRDAYRAALRRLGAGDFTDTRGYFHPASCVVLTYDGRSEASYRAASRAIERGRAEVARGRGLATDRLDALRDDLDRRSLLLEAERLDRELGAAAHELVHHLARRGGLSPRHETVPVWLHEGLAMQFEVIRGGRWAGVGRLNHHRLASWRTVAAPALEAVVRDRGLGRGYRPEAYDRAWALVYFLRKEHPALFVSLLDRLRQPAPTASAPGDRAWQALTTLSAGPIADLGAAWHRFMASLPDPGPGRY